MGVVDDLRGLMWTEELILTLLSEKEYWSKLGESLNNKKDRGKKIAEEIKRIDNKLDEEVESYIEMRGRVQEVLEQVDEINLRCVLQMRYMNNKSWDDIAKALSFSRRHVMRLHEQAVKKIECLEKIS